MTSIRRRTLTLIIGLAIKYTIGLRITDEAEVEGIDFDQHGETAYDLHTSLSSGGTGVIASITKSEGTHA